MIHLFSLSNFVLQYTLKIQRYGNCCKYFNHSFVLKCSQYGMDCIIPMPELKQLIYSCILKQTWCCNEIKVISLTCKKINVVLRQIRTQSLLGSRGGPQRIMGRTNSGNEASFSASSSQSFACP